MNKKMKKPVIIDVDTGIDDALAIILALRSERVKLKGITTVAGNSNDVGQSTNNTLRILNLVDSLEIPVAKGSNSYLTGEGKSAFTTGDDGLCNLSDTLELPNKKTQKALDFLKKTLKRSNEKVTLVGTAPPTNLAKFVKRYPGLKEKIKEIVLMGGAVEKSGNITEFAEFNFYNDPKAVETIFESGLPVTITPLDVTEKLLITKEWVLENYGDSEDTVTKFFREATVTRYELLDYDWMHLHDPLAMAIVINEDFVETKTEKLDIVTKGEKRGQIVKNGEGYKITWAHRVKADRFKNYFEEKLLKN